MNFDAQTILLVEDNEDDVFIFQRMYKQSGVVNPLQIVTDGQQALDYLTGAGRYANRTEFPVPVLVFLDLKLPLLHGLDVLAAARQCAELAATAIVVLSSSAEPRDITRAQELGATGFLVKPPRGQTVRSLVQALKAQGAPGAAPLRIEGDMLAEAARH